MATYTDPEPASGAELISVSQPLITGNFTYLHESYGKDHNFTSTSNPSVLNGDGYHKVIHFINQGGDPAPNTGGQLYTKTAGAFTQLFYENQASVVTQLTGPLAPSAVTSGYTSLPGGIVLQWGTALAALVPGAVGTTTFNTAFPNAVFMVLANPVCSGSFPANTEVANIAVDTALTTLNNFRWAFLTLSGAGVYTGFTWIAIGR